MEFYGDLPDGDYQQRNDIKTTFDGKKQKKEKKEKGGTEVFQYYVGSSRTLGSFRSALFPMPYICAEAMPSAPSN
jgi:hypothetical protein